MTYLRIVLPRELLAHNLFDGDAFGRDSLQCFSFLIPARDGRTFDPFRAGFKVIALGFLEHALSAFAHGKSAIGDQRYVGSGCHDRNLIGIVR